MRLSNYETRVLKVIDRYVRKYLRKRYAAALKQTNRRRALMLDMRIPRPAFAREQIKNFFPSLLALTGPVASSNLYSGSLGLINRCVMAKLVSGGVDEMGKAILESMRQDAGALELECMLPPERRERATVALTPIERRASAAEQSLRQWERKLKTAQSKIKKYRRRVSYYQKKGLVS